MFGVESREYN